MIIDSHTHVFPPELIRRREALLDRDVTLSTMFSDPRSRMADAEELVATMDGAAVDLSVMVGIGWNDPGLAREANDYLIDAVRRFPLRLRGFCAVNPRWGAEAVAEVERCAAAGLSGVGELHPDTQGFDLGDRSVMAPVVEAAVRQACPYSRTRRSLLGIPTLARGAPRRWSSAASSRPSRRRRSSAPTGEAACPFTP